MDVQSTNGVLQAACYSAAAFGAVYAIARFSFLKRKSNNETYAQRIEADMRQEKQNSELTEQITASSRRKLELMETSQYKNYVAKRLAAMQQAREANNNIYIDQEWSNDTIKEYLDAIVGRSPLD